MEITVEYKLIEKQAFQNEVARQFLITHHMYTQYNEIQQNTPTISFQLLEVEMHFFHQLYNFNIDECAKSFKKIQLLMSEMITEYDDSCMCRIIKPDGAYNYKKQEGYIETGEYLKLGKQFLDSDVILVKI